MPVLQQNIEYRTSTCGSFCSVPHTFTAKIANSSPYLRLWRKIAQTILTLLSPCRSVLSQGTIPETGSSRNRWRQDNRQMIMTSPCSVIRFHRISCRAGIWKLALEYARVRSTCRYSLFVHTSCPRKARRTGLSLLGSLSKYTQRETNLSVDYKSCQITYFFSC